MNYLGSVHCLLLRFHKITQKGILKLDFFFYYIILFNTRKSNSQYEINNQLFVKIAECPFKCLRKNIRRAKSNPRVSLA